MKDLYKSSLLIDEVESRKFRWHLSFSILLLFVLGSIINIPFSREVKRLSLETSQTYVHINTSIADDLLSIGISSLVLGSILTFIGLWVAARANLGAPLLLRLFSDKARQHKINWKAIFSSLLLSATVAVILLVLFEIQKEIYLVENKLTRPSKYFYSIVSVSAGISEEIMFRLALMSLIIAVIQFFNNAQLPSSKVIWSGIIISALFFGLFHLPLSKNFVDLTPFTIGVTMIGNLITGITFGWIFWKRGLLVVIISHITFDLVFHVLGTPYA